MTNQIAADAALFERVQFWRDFRSGAANLFPTDGALRWFIRSHEQALIASGVLLKLPKGTYVDPQPFRAAAINLMRGIASGHSTADSDSSQAPAERALRATSPVRDQQ